MCYYRTDDGKCRKFTDDKYTSYCVDGPCPDDTPTNADKIRSMSDTELAEWICGVYDDDESAGKFINGILIERYDEDIMLEWLQQPSETEGTE